jgi:peroxiredoxin
MTKLFSVLSISILAFVASCSNSNDYSLTVELPENDTPQQLYLLAVQNGQWIRVDSSKINEDGKYAFAYTSPQPDFLLLSKGDLKGFTIINDGKSSQNVVFTEFPAKYNPASDLNTSTQDLYNWISTSKSFEIKAGELKQRFTEKKMTQQMLIDSLNSLQQSFISTAKEFIAERQNSIVALSALQNINPVDNIELYKNLEASVSKISPNSGYVKNLQTTIKRAEEQITLQAAEAEKNARMDAILGIGKPAPNIAMNQPNGKMAQLSDLKGKVVLIDFWASWCKPCRMENPNVVKLYKKYKNKGFEIFGVSLDKSKQAWENAINADNLTWTHVSDLQLWNNAAAQLYGVSSIPATFLIDAEGNILAKNLRGIALEKKLEEIFG